MDVLNGLHTSSEISSLRKNWWMFLVRGLLALALGIIAVIDPGATIGALIFLLGAYLLGDGVVAIMKSLTAHASRRWLHAISGVIGVAIGILVLALPALTVLSLGWLVGFWAIVSGISEIVMAMDTRDHVGAAFAYGFLGLLSIVFGIAIRRSGNRGCISRYCGGNLWLLRWNITHCRSLPSQDGGLGAKEIR